MHRQASLVLLAASAALVLSGCAPEPAPGASTPTPTAAETSSPPTDAEESRLIVSIDGLELVDADAAGSAPFDDPAAVLALLEEATGEAPVQTDLQDPPGYETDLVSYDWDGLSVVTDEGGQGTFSRIVVDAATVSGVPIASEDGLVIGSTRDDVLAAQGWDVWDEDEDGIADYLGVGEQEVPGTTSLSRPGETGIQYLMFALTDDAVTQISAPADDYSDL